MGRNDPNTILWLTEKILSGKSCHSGFENSSKLFPGERVKANECKVVIYLNSSSNGWQSFFRTTSLFSVAAFINTPLLEPGIKREIKTVLINLHSIKRFGKSKRSGELIFTSKFKSHGKTVELKEDIMK